MRTIHDLSRLPLQYQVRVARRRYRSEAVMIEERFMHPCFSTAVLSLWLLAAATGCAHSPEPRSAGRVPMPPRAGSSLKAPPEVVPELPPQPASETPMAAPDAPPRKPEPHPKAPESPSVRAAADPISVANPLRARSLPKLELKNVGLHVGGGPNDAATHRAFTAPISLVFGEFQRCYRLVERPRPLAIYGVDLVVEPGSGRAKVRAIRTKLSGKAFLKCMQNVLEAVRFRNPLKQPTSVSYSVRFALSDLETVSPKR